MPIGNRLKIARITYGDLTQEELARRVACSRQTIHSIEASKFVPSVELALRIAQELQVKVEELFFLQDIKEKSK